MQFAKMRKLKTLMINCLLFAALNSYTFENMMYHVMNERVPFYSYKTLTEFWQSSSHRSRCKVIDYYVKKVIGILRILEQLDIIGR